MLFRPILPILFSLSFILGNSIKDRYTDASLSIISKALSDSTAYNRLAYLCDTFGPRLSGSKNLENAINWILKEMKKDGLVHVQGERVKVPAWIRGKESITLLKPFKKDLTMLGLGGSIATPRAGIVAEVMVVDDFKELEDRSKKAKGKIVLFNAPFVTYGQTVSYRYSGAGAAAKHGAVASLIRSIGPWSMNTPHTGVMKYEKNIKKIPHAALTMEDAMMLGRLYDRGEKIILKLEMEAKRAADRWSRNVIGQINGTTHPDEIVVVGGHIDSWDVGQGAHDDGGGCIAAWEAVRLIKELGFDFDLSKVQILKKTSANQLNVCLNNKYYDMPEFLISKKNVGITNKGIKKALIFNRNLLTECFPETNSVRIPLARNILENYYN